MIPRLKPFFNHKELAAVFSKDKTAVRDFEEKLAAKFKASYGAAFLYGRSGLYALLKCLDIKDSEVILPAYTCIVVANAVVYSGNIPRFVDVNLEDYNMDLSSVEKAINDRTRAIVGTSLFGYPYNARRLQEIIKRSGRDILLVQDCAHSFGAKYNGELVCNIGDAALFAFSLNKQISSVYGGMITTNNEAIYRKLKKYRDENFREPRLSENIKMFSLLFTAYAAFSEPFYGFTNFLERRTPVLDPIVKYYKEDTIDMPEDFLVKLPAINARIGRAQIDKYDEIEKARVTLAMSYNEALKNLEGIVPPPLIDGATYLYCVARVNDREKFIEYMRKRGIQIGKYIEYALPYMKAYEKYKTADYPNAYACAREIVNLPCYYSLSKSGMAGITARVREYFKK